MANGDGEKSERTLTPKQERFCQLYTTYWEATRAAREARYSEKSAARLGHELLKNPLVRNRIAELRDYALDEIGASRERVLLELSRLAYIDTSKAYDKLGQLLPIHEMPEDVRRAISKIKIFEQFAQLGGEKELIGFTKEVEFAPKKAALDSLAKIMGFAPDKIEHSGPDGKPIEHHDLSRISNEELDTKIQAMLAKVGVKG